MLLQTNSYIVPKERRAEHARLIRRFRQALNRLGCDQFEVYEQVGANWSPGGANGRYVQIMRFRDRQHQQAVQAAERNDPGSQQIIAEFCELINFPYQQQHGYFATGFYLSVLPIGPRQAIEYGQEYTEAEEIAGEEGPAEETSEEIEYAEAETEQETEPQGELAEEQAEEPAPAAGEGPEALAEETLEEPTEEPEPAPEALASEEEREEAPEALAEEALEEPTEESEPAPEALVSKEEREEAPEALEEEPAAESTEPAPAGGHSLGAFLDSLTEQDIPPADQFTPENTTPKPVYDYEASKAPPKPAFAESSIGMPPVVETPVDVVTADSFAPAETETAQEQSEGVSSDEAAALEQLEVLESQEEAPEEMGLVFEDEAPDEAAPPAHSRVAIAPPVPSNGEKNAKHSEPFPAATLPMTPVKTAGAGFDDEAQMTGHNAPAHSARVDNIHRDAFDALLDDANLLGHAPLPQSNASAKSPLNNEPVGIENSDGTGDKEANLLEFEAFLRELEDPSADHGHRSH